jgi:hypothetical protein
MYKRVRLMLVMLTVQFLLGMLVNLIGTPDATASALVKLSHSIILGLHLLIGFGMLIGAGIIARFIWRQPNEVNRRWARLGAISVAAAVISGILTVSTPLTEIFSFVMAAGFIGAFISYGRLWMELKQPS